MVLYIRNNKCLQNFIEEPFCNYDTKANGETLFYYEDVTRFMQSRIRVQWHVLVFMVLNFCYLSSMPLY
jgi:hypothetical protein